MATRRAKPSARVAELTRSLRTKADVDKVFDGKVLCEIREAQAVILNCALLTKVERDSIDELLEMLWRVVLFNCGKRARGRPRDDKTRVQAWIAYLLEATRKVTIKAAVAAAVGKGTAADMERVSRALRSLKSGKLNIMFRSHNDLFNAAAKRLQKETGKN